MKRYVTLICNHCRKEYTVEFNRRHHKACSRSCAGKQRKDLLETTRKAGKNSVAKQAELRRSKNERLFAELCASRFEILTNVPMFEGWDADVVIPSLKIAVLWNGPWHYKQISRSSSLIQIQNRDRLKVEAIKRCEYIPYVIQDMGKHNPEFVRLEFEKFLAEWSSGQLTGLITRVVGGSNPSSATEEIK